MSTVYYYEDFPAECIRECSASSSVDDAVAHWRKALNFTVPRDETIKCLHGYGAWTLDELTALSDDDLAEKVLWLACCDFKEWDGTEESPCGSDLFCLE